MLAGVQHGPGRRRQTDAARVEVLENRAVFAEDMSEPRQPRFSRGWIFLSHVAIEQICIQTVDFENDNSSRRRLSTICKCTRENGQSWDTNQFIPPEGNRSAALPEKAASPAGLIRMKASV